MAEKSLVSGALIAKCCGITRRQHSNLVRAGTMPKAQRGKYALAPSIQAFIAYRIAEGPASAARERLKLMEARRTRVEIDNAERMRELVDAAVVHQLHLAEHRMIVAAIRSIPQRASAIAANQPESRVREILKEEISAAQRVIAAGYGRLADFLMKEAEKAEKEKQP